MRVLGVDAGMTTGLCIIEMDGPESWRCTRRWQIEKDEDRGHALGILYAELSDLFWDTVFDAVVMEYYQAYGQNTAEEKIEAQAIVRLSCYQHGLKLYTYPPVTIRSMTVGNSRAKEAQIKAQVKYYLGMEGRAAPGEALSNHQADAILAALCHLAHRERLILAPSLTLTGKVS